MEALDPPITAVRTAVQRALAEDLEPLGDLTASLLPPATTVRARVVSREDGVLAGTACARETYVELDPAVVVDWTLRDGAPLSSGCVVAEIEGPLASVVTGERTALNFLNHLSGIATLTARFVERAAPLRVWDTRKTTPGLRALEKAAVRAGGGVDHRGNLSDWILLKDNHLAGLTITEAVRRARDRWPARTVHVECDLHAQVVEAVEAGADAVLLDNMEPDDVRRCVGTVAAAASRPLVEISGGITLENVGSYAGTGADLVSTGAITMSARALDIGLDLGPPESST